MPTGDGNWGNVTGLVAGGGFGVVVPASAGGAAAADNAAISASGAHLRRLSRAREVVTLFMAPPESGLLKTRTDSTEMSKKRQVQLQIPSPCCPNVTFTSYAWLSAKHATTKAGWYCSRLSRRHSRVTGCDQPEKMIRLFLAE